MVRKQVMNPLLCFLFTLAPYLRSSLLANACIIRPVMRCQAFFLKNTRSNLYNILNLKPKRASHKNILLSQSSLGIISRIVTKYSKALPK